MTSRLRLGVLTTSYPRHDGDPAGQFVRGLAQELARRGAELEVIAAGRHGEEKVRGVELGAGLFADGGAPDRLERDPVAWLAALGFGAAQLAAARWSVGRWDALLTHWLVPSGLCGALVAGRRPHVAIAHSGDVALLARLGLLGAVLTLLARSGARLVFVAESLRERSRLAVGDRPSAAVGRLLDEAVIAPMGVDDALLVPAARRAEVRQEERRSLGLSSLEPVALCLARLQPVKGIDVAIAAATRAGVALIVAGDGPVRSRLERLGSPRVRFVGEVDRLRAFRLLAATDLLLVPSRVLPGGRTEGAPTVVGEAFLSGVPVVASDVGGLAELVAHEQNGLLVAPDDPGVLAEAIGRLLRDPALRARLAAGALSEGERFRWATAAEPIARLLWR